MITPNPKLSGILIEAYLRTKSGNGQDFVENAIDVAFEPILEFSDAIDRLLGL